MMTADGVDSGCMKGAIRSIDGTRQNSRVLAISLLPPKALCPSYKPPEGRWHLGLRLRCAEWL